MRALPYIGVVLLWALTVGGVVFVFEQALGFDDALIEETRTPIPGKRVVRLEARRYNVFFGAGHISNPDRVGNALDDLEHSPLDIRIRAVGSDRLLQLDSYGGNFTTGGDRDETAFATVRIPREGLYQVSVTSSADLPYSSPAIALGEPIGRRVVRLVGGVIVGGVAFLGGLLLLVVTLVVRSRRTTSTT